MNGSVNEHLMISALTMSGSSKPPDNAAHLMPCMIQGGIGPPQMTARRTYPANVRCGDPEVRNPRGEVADFRTWQRPPVRWCGPLVVVLQSRQSCNSILPPHPPTVARGTHGSKTGRARYPRTRRQLRLRHRAQGGRG